MPLPGGGVAEVKLDFDVLARLGELARSRGLAGAVQHGASTLPDELFHRFPEAETAEIHLATGFQNALYEHPAFPAALMDEIYAWCEVNAADERKDGQTDDQFLYTTRKKAIGPFKRQLWDLSTKDEILASQGAKIGYLFTQLRVDGSLEMVNRYVFQNALYEHPAFPAELMNEIYAWCKVNAADERKDGQTEDQFLYTTRKKAIGPFKRQLWDLSTKDEILASQGAKIGYLFTQLRVDGSLEMVNKYVKPVAVSRPIPEALKVAAG